MATKAARTAGVEVFQSPENQRWYWRRRAANGRLTARSSGAKASGYGRRDTAVEAAKRDNPGLPVEVLDRYTVVRRRIKP